MTRIKQIAFAMIGAALILSTTSPSMARTHELRSPHSTYVDQLGPRTVQRHWDNPHQAQAQAPAVHRRPAFDDPPGSAFQDQGERDSIGD